MELDRNNEALVVHIASLTSKITIYLAWETQIVLLLAKRVTVLMEYADFVNVFLKELAEMLSKRTDINEHTIKLEESKQLPYRSIYSLGPIEFKTLKTYIKTHLVIDFIRPLKSPTGAPIFFYLKAWW